MQEFDIAVTGYVAENLCTLVFSSEFGDNDAFGVAGLAIGAKGDLVLGGTTGSSSQEHSENWTRPAPPNCDPMVCLAPRDRSLDSLCHREQGGLRALEAEVLVGAGECSGQVLRLPPNLVKGEECVRWRDIV